MSKTKYRGLRNANKRNDFLEELILMEYGEYTKEPVFEADGGFQVLTVGAVAVGLTMPAGGGLTGENVVGSATIMCEGEEGLLIRYKQNGTDPTEAEGFFLYAGDILEVGREQLEEIKFISGKNGVESKLQIQYYLSIELDLTN